MQSKYRLNEKYLSNNPLFIEMPFSRGYQFTGGLLIYKKMEIGQTVYVKPESNEARNDKRIVEAIVTSIGSKYFTIET